MAGTRFRLPATGVAAVSPAFSASWGHTSSAARRPLVVNPSNTTHATSQVTETSAGPINVLHRQFVSDPLPAQNLKGTFTLVIRAQEASSAQDDMLQIILRVVSNDGTTFRGTAFAGQTVDVVSAVSTDPNFEISTGEVTRTLVDIPLTQVAVQANDRLVAEIGRRSCEVAANSRIGNMRFGDLAATADHDLTLGIATDLRPWLEFSRDLFNPPPEGSKMDTLSGSLPGSGSVSDRLWAQQEAAYAGADPTEPLTMNDYLIANGVDKNVIQ